MHHAASKTTNTTQSCAILVSHGFLDVLALLLPLLTLQLSDQTFFDVNCFSMQEILASPIAQKQTSYYAISLHFSYCNNHYLLHLCSPFCNASSSSLFIFSIIHEVRVHFHVNLVSLVWPLWFVNNETKLCTVTQMIVLHH